MNNLLIANPGQRGILLNDSSASLSLVTIQNSRNTALEINTTANPRTVTATGLNITNTVVSIKGIDANVIGAGNLLLNISGTPGSATASNSISVQQDAVNVSTGVGSTGKATVQLSSLTVASSAGAGIVVDGSAANHGIHLDNITGTINSTTTNIVYSQDPAAILIENIPPGPAISLVPKFGALTIESLFDNTEATNISLPGVNTGIDKPIYTAPLTIVFP